MPCKLVKQLVTSLLVQTEAEVCNVLVRRGCAMVELSMKGDGEEGGDPAVGSASILVCCAVADLRLTYPPLHAALLLPPEFLSLASVVSAKPQWDVTQLGAVLRSPYTQGNIPFCASVP